MLRQLVISAALIAIGTISVAAQQSDVILRKVEVLGADYDIVFAMSRPAATPIDRSNKEDPLTIHAIGGELAYATKGEIEAIFREVGLPVMPTQAFRLDFDVKAPNALNVYVFPRIGPPIQ